MDTNAATSETVARDRELFALVAQTHPGVIRTLAVLVGELLEIDLDPELTHQLGEHIRRVGETVINRSGRVVLEPASEGLADVDGIHRRLDVICGLLDELHGMVTALADRLHHGDA